MGTPMRWRAAALALAGWLALSATAAAAVTLTVAVFPSVDQVVAEALPAWRALHPDIEIKLVSREFNDHHNAMALALAGGAGTVDVMALELARLRRFTDGSGLENLAAPPYDAGRFRDRYAAYAYRLGANARGEQMALPADLGPGSLFYRADLLRRAHVDEAELTRSWGSYLAAGKAIKAATGAYLLGHARDLKDIMIRAGVADGEGLFFDRAGRCLVEGPRFVRAFELARELRRAGLDARVNTWSNEWVESLRRGTVATQVMGGWLAGHLERRYALDSSGQWRVAQLPEHAYVFWGGTFYAMPRAGRNKAAAWQFIQFLTLNTQVQLAGLRSQHAFPALLAAQESPLFDQPLPFLGGQPARQLWRSAARRIEPIESNRHDALADEIVSVELDEVLEHDKPVARALADAHALILRRTRSAR